MKNKEFKFCQLIEVLKWINIKEFGAKLYQDFEVPGCSAKLACSRPSVAGKEQKNESNPGKDREPKTGLGDKQDSGNRNKNCPN